MSDLANQSAYQTGVPPVQRPADPMAGAPAGAPTTYVKGDPADPVAAAVANQNRAQADPMMGMAPPVPIVPAAASVKAPAAPSPAPPTQTPSVKDMVNYLSSAPPRQPSERNLAGPSAPPPSISGHTGPEGATVTAADMAGASVAPTGNEGKPDFWGVLKKIAFPIGAILEGAGKGATGNQQPTMLQTLQAQKFQAQQAELTRQAATQILGIQNKHAMDIQQAQNAFAMSAQTAEDVARRDQAVQTANIQVQGALELQRQNPMTQFLIKQGLGQKIQDLILKAFPQ